MKRILFVFFLAAVMCICGCQTDTIHVKKMETVTGREMEAGGIRFSREKAEKQNEVRPEKPNGYYNYYEEQEGFHYFVVSGEAVNDSGQAVDAGHILLRGRNDKKVYEGKLLFSNQDDSDLIKQLDGGETRKFYIVILVKDREPDPTGIEIYYNAGFRKQRKNEEFDKMIFWMMD